MQTETDNFNRDELQAPAWLNKTFFEQVLKQADQTDFIQVKSFELAPATVKGDNFASAIFRLTVDYQIGDLDKKRILIVKTLAEYESKKADLLKASKHFETEIAVYSKVIPKFQKILKEMGDDTKLGVSCLYQALKPKEIIILEDMLTIGFTVMRERKPNLMEAKAIFAKLAKWHAVSFKVHKEEPTYFDDVRNGLFMPQNVQDIAPFNEGFANFLELFETDEELKHYKPYFEPFAGSLVNKIMDSFCEAYNNPQTGGLYGLCHGDFHYKNLLFKHEPKTKKLLDVMLLDFQMCYLGPIVNDILYATYMMFDTDLRANHLEELYDYYFSIFQETLSKLSFKGYIPNIFEFKKQLKKHQHFEVFLFAVCLPIWYALSDGTIEPEVLFIDKDETKTVWKNTVYVMELKDFVNKIVHSVGSY